VTKERDPERVPSVERMEGTKGVNNDGERQHKGERRTEKYKH